MADKQQPAPQKQYLIMYDERDKSQFPEGGDAWSALNAGYIITMTKQGQIVDIWDPRTGNRYNITGTKIGHRNKPLLPISDKYAAWLKGYIAAKKPEEKLPPGKTESMMYRPKKPTTWQEADKSIKEILQAMLMGIVRSQPDFLSAAEELIDREMTGGGVMTDTDLTHTMQEVEECWGEEREGRQE